MARVSSNRCNILSSLQWHLFSPTLCLWDAATHSDHLQTSRQHVMWHISFNSLSIMTEMHIFLLCILFISYVRCCSSLLMVNKSTCKWRVLSVCYLILHLLSHLWLFLQVFVVYNVHKKVLCFYVVKHRHIHREEFLWLSYNSTLLSMYLSEWNGFITGQYISQTGKNNPIKVTVFHFEPNPGPHWEFYLPGWLTVYENFHFTNSMTN